MNHATALGTPPRGVHRTPGNGVHGGIRAVVFDLDGTLIDGRLTYLGRTVAVLQGLERATVGNPSPSIRTRGFAVLRTVTEPWYTRLRRQVVLSPEAEAVLAALAQAGLTIGIITNGTARKRGTIQLLGLERRAACILISGEVGERKPDQSMFDRLTTELALPAAAIVFVGDRPRQDVAGARAAGMHTVWLRHGPAWLNRLRDPHAEWSITSLPELPGALGVA